MNPSWYGVFAIVVWSSLALVITLARDIPPFQLAGISWFMGFIFLSAYYAVLGEKIMPHFKRPISDYLFVCGGVCGYSVLVFAAFHLIPPFEANVLNYLWPIFLTLFLRLFQGVSVTSLKIAGLCLGFTGSFLLFADRYEGGSLDGIHIGHVLAVAGAAVWALYSCLAKTRSYPTAFMVPVYLVSAIVCFTAHILFEKTVWPEWMVWIAIVILGLSRVSYAFWDYAMRQGDRALIGSLSYLIPLISTSILIIGGYSANSGAIAIAGLMIVGGCLIVNLREIVAAFSGRFRK